MTCVTFQTIVYLSHLKPRNELCVGKTGHFTSHE